MANQYKTFCMVTLTIVLYDSLQTVLQGLYNKCYPNLFLNHNLKYHKTLKFHYHKSEQASEDSIDLVPLNLDINESGLCSYNITEDVDAYVPVDITVSILQKNIDEVYTSCRIQRELKAITVVTRPVRRTVTIKVTVNVAIPTNYLQKCSKLS